jgi:hypothetical protein
MPDPYMQGSESITQAEHISPTKTGDNIQAKRTANYIWNGTEWVRMAQPGGLTPGIDFDYLDVQQTDADTETYVFKTGGSGGTTVRTIVVNYTSSSKSDIDNVTWT